MLDFNRIDTHKGEYVLPLGPTVHARLGEIVIGEVVMVMKNLQEREFYAVMKKWDHEGRWVQKLDSSTWQEG